MKKLTAQLILSCLLFLSSPCGAQENSITLTLTVTNTSKEKSQEIPVVLDLPKELNLSDIVSSDGLTIEYDSEKKNLVAKDRVTLQASETTFFNIVTRDVWVIPESEIRALRAEMDAFRFSSSEYYVQQQITGLIEAVDRILEQQNSDSEDTPTHIKTFRAYHGIYTEIKKNFETINKLQGKNRNSNKADNAAGPHLGFFVGGASLLMLFVFIFLNYRKALFAQLKYFQFGNQIRFAKIFNPTTISCRLLINDDNGLPAEQVRPFEISSRWAGQICLLLKDSYRAQTVLEIKIHLVNPKKIISFRGSVIWQKAFSELFLAHYLTGLTISEISRDDLHVLKEYIQAQQNG